MTTDILGNELKKGDVIVYTTKRVELHKGTVVEINTQRPSRWNKTVHSRLCIRVKGDKNKLTGWTYANRCCKITFS